MTLDKDLHSSPKTQTVSAKENGIRLRHVRLQWSKEEIGFSLHASPSSFSLSGIQETDFLSYLGFDRTHCPFLNGDGYCRWTTETIDTTAFSEAFGRAYSILQQAQQHLEACGFSLPQPEGIGHFYGKPSRGGTRSTSAVHGDGHTSPQTQPMKTAEDANFRYALTWIEGGSDKGWTTHYRPQHDPMSPEISAALQFLSLQQFVACPEFDFEQCYWRFMPFSREHMGGFGNADAAHRHFEAHATAFSSGIKKLLEANAAMEPFQMGFLPLSLGANERQEAEIEKRIRKPRQPPRIKGGHDFDVAISFAGTDRPTAERIANRLKDAGLSVFYDNFHPEELWGKNLVDFFDDIYQRRSRYCLILVSKDYVEREWTNHERQSAQARRHQEKGSDYILPIQIDGTTLPGLPPTVGYMSLNDRSVEEISDLLLRKLEKP